MVKENKTPVVFSPGIDGACHRILLAIFYAKYKEKKERDIYLESYLPRTYDMLKFAQVKGLNPIFYFKGLEMIFLPDPKTERKELAELGRLYKIWKRYAFKENDWKNSYNRPLQRYIELFSKYYSSGGVSRKLELAELKELYEMGAEYVADSGPLVRRYMQLVKKFKYDGR